MADEPLWRPSDERVAGTLLHDFLERVRADRELRLDGYPELHRWSVEELEEFWLSVWDFCGVMAAERGATVVQDRDRMPGAHFFPEARLNFAENLLRHRGDEDALVFRGEDRVRRRLSRDELHDRVARLVRALESMGVEEGDRVAAFMPNVPGTVVAMLAAASLGAVFSSCSPDFGVDGVLDRFGQIEPKVVFCADGYWFKGKAHDSLERVGTFLGELPSVSHVIVDGYLAERPDLGVIRRVAEEGPRGTAPEVVLLDDALARHAPGEIDFRELPFNHPLYVMFSSGTTGKPKCIVHGAGGTLLKHLCEHQLMCDVRPGDRAFYFTTCGWMMWNWLVSGLASGATLLLYDGSPFHPTPDVLFDLAEAESMTLFGTSAKYIDALANAGRDPRSTHDLSSLRTVTSTGSPLLPEGFDYVYEHIHDDVCLSSISGGTDIIGCFVGGNPIGPVWRGEIQAPVLGMAVDVYDDDGEPVRQQKGELVCTEPFPSMPVRFWDDPGDERYRGAYFDAWPGVWRHGDYAEITEHGGVIIYGRSDATLNPGGVRIGTAEIYRQVEKLAEIAEALVIGQEWQGDVRVVLFVRLADDGELTPELRHRIRREVREGASPRHVPSKILQVHDIPRTKSGKIVELAVRDVVHGREVENVSALANPEALDEYRGRDELDR